VSRLKNNNKDSAVIYTALNSVRLHLAQVKLIKVSSHAMLNDAVLFIYQST